MSILYIDTHNTKIFEIGFAKDNQLKKTQGEDASLAILEKIEELTNNNFNKIIICTGPGSLTGLRIGSCFAQGIALGKGIKVYGISIWDLIFEENLEITILFNTGTKKWIKKTMKQEILEENPEDPKTLWTSNKAHLLTNFDQKTYQKWPNMIDLMHQYAKKASRNINLLYSIDLFNK